MSLAKPAINWSHVTGKRQPPALARVACARNERHIGAVG